VATKKREQPPRSTITQTIFYKQTLESKD